MIICFAKDRVSFKRLLFLTILMCESILQMKDSML